MRNLFFLFGPSNRGRRRGARTNQVRARGIESSVSVWNASSGYAKLAKLITAKATLRCSYANDAPPSPTPLPPPCIHGEKVDSVLVGELALELCLPCRQVESKPLPQLILDILSLELTRADCLPPSS